MKKREIFYGIFIVLFLLLILNTNTILFLYDFFYDQVILILRSEDIKSVIDNNLEDIEIITQLKLVPEIMLFGDEVGFPETNAYSKYAPLKREVFYYSLSASKKDKLEDYIWKWPFIGGLPYKGFIDKKDAVKEEEMLKSKGYDTYIGKSSTISTFGIFSDPITTIMINKTDPTVLIDTIFHERTHQLFFKKNHVTFNENSAVLLGALTALEFVKEEFGENSTEYNTQLDWINDLLLFSKFIDEFYQELDDFYSSDMTSEEKIVNRKYIFRKNIERFKIFKKGLHKSFKNFDEKEINNAYILSYFRYYGKIYLYYEVYRKLGNNLQETIQFFNNTAHSEGEPDKIIKNFIER